MGVGDQAGEGGRCVVGHDREDRAAHAFAYLHVPRALLCGSSDRPQLPGRSGGQAPNAGLATNASIYYALRGSSSSQRSVDGGIRITARDEEESRKNE